MFCEQFLLEKWCNPVRVIPTSRNPVRIANHIIAGPNTERNFVFLDADPSPFFKK